MRLLCRLGVHRVTHQVERREYLWCHPGAVLRSYWVDYGQVCGRCGQVDYQNVPDHSLPLVDGENTTA